MSQKWKGFENNVAKELSSWLFDDPKILRRSPCSGGWKERGSDGDVILAAEREEFESCFPFCIEAKCRKSRGEGEWHFEQLLTSKKHPILSWWSQLTNSNPVKEKGKLRLLVFSKTSGTAKAFLAFGKRELNFFIKSGISLRYLPKVVFDFGGSEDPNVESTVLYIFNFREFLSSVDIKPLLTIWKDNDVT